MDATEKIVEAAQEALREVRKRAAVIRAVSGDKHDALAHAHHTGGLHIFDAVLRAAGVSGMDAEFARTDRGPGR